MATLGLLYIMAAMGGLGIPRRAHPIAVTEPTYPAVPLLFAAIHALGQAANLIQLTRPKLVKPVVVKAAG